MELRRSDGMSSYPGTNLERPLRLATGLILFGFAASHLINHVFGIRSLDAMEAASDILLKPWRSYPGLFILYGAFLVHGGLGLFALYRRRHLHLPAGEAWQLALGLAIPLLLFPHVVGVRVADSLGGMGVSYQSVLYRFWVAWPEVSLPRQFLLLLVLWIHGCIGVRAWLRSKSWYRAAASTLASMATLV